jgi:hypothetical protein
MFTNQIWGYTDEAPAAGIYQELGSSHLRSPSLQTIQVQLSRVINLHLYINVLYVATIS